MSPRRRHSRSPGSPTGPARSNTRPEGPMEGSPRMTSRALLDFTARVARLLLRSELVGILAPVVVVAGAMSFAFPGFASAFNVEALLATIAVGSVVGLAQVAVLAVGQFNLALPAIGAFTGMAVGWLLQVGGLPWPVA